MARQNGAHAPAGKPTYLDELSEELAAVSTRLARYAADERRRCEAAAREPIRVGQLQAVLAARYARSERLGVDLANAGWSLMLELFLASLQRRPVRLSRLAADARVPATTAMRWIDQFIDAGLVRRDSHPELEGATALVLTDAGSEAMEDHFVALLLGWVQADAPE